MANVENGDMHMTSEQAQEELKRFMDDIPAFLTLLDYHITDVASRLAREIAKEIISDHGHLPDGTAAIPAKKGFRPCIYGTPDGATHKINRIRRLVHAAQRGEMKMELTAVPQQNGSY